MENVCVNAQGRCTFFRVQVDGNGHLQRLPDDGCATHPSKRERTAVDGSTQHDTSNDPGTKFHG